MSQTIVNYSSRFNILTRLTTMRVSGFSRTTSFPSKTQMFVYNYQNQTEYRMAISRMHSKLESTRDLSNISISDFEPKSFDVSICRNLQSLIPEVSLYKGPFTGILDLKEFDGYDTRTFSKILGFRRHEIHDPASKLYLMSVSKKIFGQNAVLYDLIKKNSFCVENEDSENDLIVLGSK